MLAVVAFLALMPTETPYRVTPKIPDVLAISSPSQVHLDGYIGQRIKVNEQNRLVQVDLKPLLEGFHKQPGSHPWIGEHIGKWIHASTLAWANTGDAKLKTKLDSAVKELISCQQADGYLGTYAKEKRFGLYEGSDWDVWTHKYDLLGLLTYYRFTGDQASLKTCQKIGDLLINTFGPGKKSILSAGTHMGMAATSILEPIVLLYRHTGEARYLAFAKYIVGSWEDQGGPKIISTLERGLPIDKVGNGKAYEMLSNLVGLCELARVTGNQTYLNTAKRAWADVVKHELYITGTASYYEHFHPGEDLPNETSKNVGETCVTVTWMQLSQQLLRLTGEAKYAAEFERSEYNHLAAAQNSDGKSWCYYTSLQGKKPFTTETCCCLSSGPRGMAIIPETAYMTQGSGKTATLVVNTFESSSFTTESLSPYWITNVKLTSGFPSSGVSTLKIDATKMKNIGMAGYRPPNPFFGVKIRVPAWMQEFKCSVAGKLADGWYVIPLRSWKKEDLRIVYRMHVNTVQGAGVNQGMLAKTFGPFVMAAVKRPSPTGEMRTTMESFADIAATPGLTYRIWLPKPGTTIAAQSLFQDAEESRSAEGNADGSICDGDPGSYVVTFDGKPQKEAWFMVEVDKPVTVSRFVFTQGRTFHDGGWFDASKGKPKIEIQVSKGGEWITLGPFAKYPDTTATDAKGLRGSETFTLTMLRDLKVVAVRVVGTPACGDNPNQAFASCGELQAFP